jgi:SAM-dependent methyltransferase
MGGRGAPVKRMTARASSFDAAYFARSGTTKDAAAVERYVAVLKRHASRGGRLLDVGCGTGGMLDRLQAESQWRCEGVDISREAVARAASIAPVICADAADLPFAQGEFDAILMLDVLEHTESPLQALKEARRVVNEASLLIASTPNAGSPLRVVLGKHWHGLSDPTHLYFFTRFGLEHLLRVAGWRTVTCYTFSSAPGPLGRLFEAAHIGGELCVVAEAAQ